MNSRKLRLLIYLFLLIIISAGFYLVLMNPFPTPAHRQQALSVFNQSWAMNDLWEDGKAEVAIYDAERVVYGATRHYDYTYILVKETFNREFEVKTDNYDKNDLFDVMKVNKFARIETHKYPYHYLTSLFFTREDPASLYKLTHSSQEWCGNTFKHIHDRGNEYLSHYDSYWDNQGRGSTSIPSDVIFEDQLSYSLRALDFEEGMTFDVRLIGSQVNNQFKAPEIYEAEVSVKGDGEAPSIEGLDVPGKLWKVSVILEDEKTIHYWFGKEYPNYLMKMEAWDGRKMELKSIKRDTYWD